MTAKSFGHDLQTHPVAKLVAVRKGGWRNDSASLTVISRVSCGSSHGCPQEG